MCFDTKVKGFKFIAAILNPYTETNRLFKT